MAGNCRAVDDRRANPQWLPRGQEIGILTGQIIDNRESLFLTRRWNFIARAVFRDYGLAARKFSIILADCRPIHFERESR